VHSKICTYLCFSLFRKNHRNTNVEIKKSLEGGEPMIIKTTRSNVLKDLRIKSIKTIDFSKLSAERKLELNKIVARLINIS
jgi:hypothetical protein